MQARAQEQGNDYLFCPVFWYLYALMELLRIKGNIALKGEVTISGAKNAALPIMSASLLSEGIHTIKRIPLLRDIYTMSKLLGNLGAKVELDKDKCVIDTSEIANFTAPYELVKTMRASVLVLGPLLSKYGRARVSLPGGCAIGARPVNLHIAGLKKMGAEIDLQDGYIVAEASRLRGARIYFDIPTVTGTENLMMAATLAEGTTVLENCAREPEVVDLANCLISMGAKISGAGQSIIEIEGVSNLKPIADYEIIPDRIETGTFIIASAITGGDVLVKDCMPEHLDAILLKLSDVGVRFKIGTNWIHVRPSENLVCKNVKTMPYPGFPTDMQAQFMALMCVANGASVINETIFENRFMHVAELRRLGADIDIDGNTATVRGGKLKGAHVMATDLRASASLVLAGLAAKGTTYVHRIYHLDRGYEKMDEKLSALGADIQRLKEPQY